MVKFAKLKQLHAVIIHMKVLDCLLTVSSSDALLYLKLRKKS